MRAEENGIINILKTICYILGVTLVIIIIFSFLTVDKNHILKIIPFDLILQAITILIAILNLMVFYILTDKINKYSNIKDRPILIFECKNGTWSIINVGAGAALNMIILEYRDDSKKEHSKKKAYSLGINNIFEITWFHKPYEFEVYYTDIFGKVYLSKCNNDITTILESDINQYQKVLDLSDRYISDFPPTTMTPSG